MGGGIWSMHFVAMLAARLPGTVDYLVFPTLLRAAAHTASTADDRAIQALKKPILLWGALLGAHVGVGGDVSACGFVQIPVFEKVNSLQRTPRCTITAGTLKVF